MSRLAFIMSFFCATLLADRIRAADPVSVHAEFFESGGKKIRVDIFESQQRKVGRAVLVLHGAGGIIFDGPEMRRVARSLAKGGNTAYLIHYFNRTGTLFGRDDNMQKYFETWLPTVRDSIDWARNRNPSRASVGIYGYSLGAFLALAAASDNPQVAAVVEQAGGVWNGKTERIGQMPPVFVIHGKQDKRVPFAKYAETLVTLLHKRQADVKTHFFPNERHGFAQAAMVEVREEVVKYFALQLRRK